MQHMTKKQRALRDADFERREQPRVMWDSQQQGTAIRVVDTKGQVHYARKPITGNAKKQLTEAEDNAIGRAIRRRQNKRQRGWLPYAQR